VDYIIALGNEQLRCVEFCDTLVERLSSMVSNKYAMAVGKSMDEAMGGFLDVANNSLQLLIDIVFNDLKLVFHQMFTPQWYAEDLVMMLVDTVVDYTQDFNSTLKDYLFNRLMREMLTRFLVEYINAMRAKPAHFKMPQAKNQFRIDLEATSQAFSEFLDEEVVRDAFDPLFRLTGFISGSADILYLEFHQLRKRYPDFDVTLAEQVLSKREDMRKDQLREIMDTIKSKLDAKLKVETPSIFSKLKEMR
jgi:hypothetical protein